MWNWLVHHGLYEALVSAAVFVLVTGVLIGLIVKPAWKNFRRVWRAHEATQTRIANNLDTTTPGGLSEIKGLLEENIQRGQE